MFADVEIMLEQTPVVQVPEGAVIAFEDIGTPNAAVLASTEDGPRW